MSRIILLITLFIFGCASQKPIEPNQVIDFDVPEQWEVNISQNLDFDQKWWNIFNDDNLNSFMIDAENFTSVDRPIGGLLLQQVATGI